LREGANGAPEIVAGAEYRLRSIEEYFFAASPDVRERCVFFPRQTGSSGNKFHVEADKQRNRDAFALPQPITQPHAFSSERQRNILQNISLGVSIAYKQTP
jgi:hypothetical protein